MQNFHDHRCRTSENIGVLNLTGVQFSYISYKNEISHIFPSEHAIYSKLIHNQDTDDRNKSWSWEENLMTLKLDMIWPSFS